jgi:hypothetical protein
MVQKQEEFYISFKYTHETNIRNVSVDYDRDETYYDCDYVDQTYKVSLSRIAKALVKIFSSEEKELKQQVADIISEDEEEYTKDRLEEYNASSIPELVDNIECYLKEKHKEVNLYNLLDHAIGLYEVQDNEYFMDCLKNYFETAATKEFNIEMED